MTQSEASDKFFTSITLILADNRLGAIVSVLRGMRTPRSSAFLLTATLIVLALLLGSPKATAAQTSPASVTRAAPASPTQTASDDDQKISPAAHADAAPIEIPTAAQIEAAAGGETPEAPDPNPASAGTNPAPAAANPASAAPVTAAHPSATAPTATSGLAPKYDVTQIGQRNVGSGLDFYSLDREVALGRQLSQEVEASARLVTDPVINEYVNRIGQNLVRNSDARVPFTIKVLDTEEVNAFALPGGFFYVNSGLILAADNEAELAGVMAHEIAHVAARHATKNMTRAQIWNMASVPLIFIGGPVAYAISEVASLAVPLGFLKFSRDAEREADLLGLQYDYATGYDPQAFVEFFEKLNVEKKKPQPGRQGVCHSSHERRAHPGGAGRNPQISA